MLASPVYLCEAITSGNIASSSAETLHLDTLQDELAKLDAEIEARHAKELQELDRAAAAATAAVAAATTAANGTSSSSAGTAQQTVTAAGSSADAGDKASKYLKELDLDEGPTDEGSGKGKVGFVTAMASEKAGACISYLTALSLPYLHRAHLQAGLQALENW